MMNDVKVPESYGRMRTDSIHPAKRRARIYDVFKRIFANVVGGGNHAAVDGQDRASADFARRIADISGELEYLSETDAPVELFEWPAGVPFAVEALRERAGIDAGEPVRTDTVERFLQSQIGYYEPSDAYEREQVEGFKALRDLFTTELRDTVVWKFGTTAMTAFVVGRAADGRYVGVQTKLVET